MVRLCYEKDGYIFILTIDDSLLTQIKTRNLLGYNTIHFKKYVDIVKSDTGIALIPYDVHRMYQIPGSSKRIHLHVPVSQMDWFTPTIDELNIIIYVEG